MVGISAQYSSKISKISLLVYTSKEISLTKEQCLCHILAILNEYFTNIKQAVILATYWNNMLHMSAQSYEHRFGYCTNAKMCFSVHHWCNIGRTTRATSVTTRSHRYISREVLTPTVAQNLWYGLLPCRTCRCDSISNEFLVQTDTACVQDVRIALTQRSLIFCQDSRVGRPA